MSPGKTAAPPPATNGQARSPDGTTSHSTRPPKDGSQVAGYLPGPLGEATSHSTRLPETAAKSLVIPQAGEGDKASLREPQVKLFVLDTNVLMHDPTSLFRFEEHDIYLPMFVLEELDNGKKGMSEVARNARQASRFLDSIVSETAHDIGQGIPLQIQGNQAATGRLFLQTQLISHELPPTLEHGKADNAILGVMLFLQKQQPKHAVILV
ncbi:MAG: PhoH family protein, partial [Nitrosomonadales bacterium]|nr:PhoH family protein [Nitrosomonadales bacterium]